MEGKRAGKKEESYFSLNAFVDKYTQEHARVIGTEEQRHRMETSTCVDINCIASSHDDNDDEDDIGTQGQLENQSPDGLDTFSSPKVVRFSPSPNDGNVAHSSSPKVSPSRDRQSKCPGQNEKDDVLIRNLLKFHAEAVGIELEDENDSVSEVDSVHERNALAELYLSDDSSVDDELYEEYRKQLSPVPNESNEVPSFINKKPYSNDSNVHTSLGKFLSISEMLDALRDDTESQRQLGMQQEYNSLALSDDDEAFEIPSRYASPLCNRAHIKTFKK